MSNNKINLIPYSGFHDYSEKLVYLRNLINDLYKEEKYLLPVFLLRCQLIEFSIKYLLIKHPYKPNNFDEKIVDDLTLGKAIGILKKFKDPYMEEIIEKSDKLKNDRNELTHNFIKSEMNINEINKIIKKKMKLANQIEENIFYFFEFVEKLYRS